MSQEMNFNRFSLLSESSELDEDVKIKYTEKSDEKTNPSERLLTQNSLNLFDIVENNVNSLFDLPRSLLVDVKIQIWQMMKSYTLQKDLSNINIVYPEDFPRFFKKKSREYFRRLVYHIEGFHHGKIIVLYSWHLGKFPDGKSRHVYIGNIRDYGSCTLCDYYDGLADELREIKNYNGEINENIDIQTNKKIRKIMKQNAADVYETLKFFNGFHEAKKWVLDKTRFSEKPVEFLDMKKLIEEIKKKSEEIKNQESIKLNNNNFPSIN